MANPEILKYSSLLCTGIGIRHPLPTLFPFQSGLALLFTLELEVSYRDAEVALFQINSC